MATIQDVFSHIYTTEAHLGDVAVKNGQIILCVDSEKLYIDHGTTRVGTSDVVYVENEAALPLAPLDKFYITQDTGDLFFYINGVWKKLNDTINDYTAFRVYPHETAIPVGHDAIRDEDYVVEVPASMTHKFIIRSQQNKDLQNVMVDWGDGTITSLKDDDVVWENKGDRRYTLTHTYSTTGVYTVKVYGTTYFCIWHFEGNDNILCEALTSYLPVASCHHNLSRFLAGAQCVTWVQCGLFTFANKTNIDLICAGCKNLTIATGFSALPKLRSAEQVFSGCSNLVTTDYVFPTSVDTQEGYYLSFSGCSKLVRSLKDFFPAGGFQSKKLKAYDMFLNAALLTWSDEIAQKLWKDPTIEWTDTSTAFVGCSDEVRSHVPISWGGTSAEEIVGNLPVAKLSLNGTLPNTANGLLMLNASGKVDSSFLPPQAAVNIDNYTSNNTIKLTSTAGAVDLISNTGEVGLYSGSTSHIKANVDTIELTATTLSFNGNDQNVAGGIAVIDKSTGKLPESILPEIAGTDLSNYVGGVDITATGATYIRNGQTGDYALLIGMDQYYGLNITNTSSKEITLAATLDGEGTINLVAPTLKMKTTLTGTHFFAYDADHISVIHGTEVDLTGGSSSLSIHNGLSMIVAKGGFGINASGKNILLTCDQLYLNNHRLNSANGLVQLNDSGKVPTNLLPEMSQSWTKQTISQSSFTTDDSTYGGKYMELNGICSVEVYDADGYKVEFDVKCDFTGNKTRIYIPSGLTADTISNWTLLYLAKAIA